MSSSFVTDVPRILLQAPSDEALGAFVLLILFFALIVIVAAVLLSIWIYRDCKQRGENPGLWIGLFLGATVLFSILAGLVVILIYVLTRGKEIKYDKQGNPLIPTQPPAVWTPQPTAASAWSSPAATAPPTAGPVVSGRVRCPRCHTIFEYNRDPIGSTRVKCPACGQEGSI